MAIELLEKTETDALYDVLYPILCRDDVRHIVPLSGKDSLSTFWIVLKFCQDNGIDPKRLEVLFNPTGFELKAVDEWMTRVEARFDITINRIGDDLEEIIRDANYLPSFKERFCTRLAKIFPMEDWIGTSTPTFVYYGIRADERRAGYQSLSAKKTNITPVYPLKLAGYTLPMVWKLVHDIDLVPPQFFWQEMYDMVHARLGVVADILIDGLSPWERTMLFAWRSRPNCHNCYNQSLWEWVGLLEHEPETFAWNEAFELEIGGSDQREKAFTFKQGWPLARIQTEKEVIKRKRCIKICKLIMKRAKIELTFEDDEDDDGVDMLDIVSCGLFCGK